MTITAAAAPPDPASLYRYERTARVIASPDLVNEEEIAAYHRDGFLAVANLLTPAEVAETKAALSDLLYGRVPGYADLQPEPDLRDKWPTMTTVERADAVRKVWLFAEFEPRLKSLAVEQPVIQTLLTRLLGEPCDLIQDMALLKPPHVGTEKPWHQDMAYFKVGPPEKVMGVWIALDPATAENGCMHVLPGTHREGPVAHTHVRDCQIPDERVRVDRDVIVPLAPGGALFFASLLHHGTPPNRSANRRWALQYHYAARSCRPMDRVEHATLFFEEDRYAGCRGPLGQKLSEMTP
jgi:phytanoyl-CoA hydroxylase